MRRGSVRMSRRGTVRMSRMRFSSVHGTVHVGMNKFDHDKTFKLAFKLVLPSLLLITSRYISCVLLCATAEGGGAEGGVAGVGAVRRRSRTPPVAVVEGGHGGSSNYAEGGGGGGAGPAMRVSPESTCVPNRRYIN